MNPWLIGVPAAVAAGVAGITLYGAGFPRAQLFGPAVWHTPAANKLALTFDDGPNPAITPKLLELLAKTQRQSHIFSRGQIRPRVPVLSRKKLPRRDTRSAITQTRTRICSFADAGKRVRNFNAAAKQFSRPPGPLRAGFVPPSACALRGLSKSLIGKQCAPCCGRTCPATGV